MNNPEIFPFPHPRHCPTPAEVSSNKTIIHELDREIDEVTEQINILQKQLHLLRKRRENHASYISPLRCLPPEIIEEIIRVSIKEGAQITVLTEICGTIRDIAIGMSDIWSRLLLTHGGWPYMSDYMVRISYNTAVGHSIIPGAHFSLECIPLQYCSHPRRCKTP
jgi:hypothetical protein